MTDLQREYLDHSCTLYYDLYQNYKDKDPARAVDYFQAWLALDTFRNLSTNDEYMREMVGRKPLPPRS